MGIKLSRATELFKGNLLHSVNMDLPTKPYSFLDGDEIKSSSIPTMVKCLRKANTNGHPGLQGNAGSTSVAFLRDERYLVFGSICTNLDTYAIEDHLFNQGLLVNDNLSLVDLELAQMQVLVNRPVRDVCLSSSCKHVGVLMYSGYSRLQVFPCDETPQLNNSQIFEEKNLISHSTCCAFSPDGKWLVVGLCSDYFTVRSRSHLAITQVNLCQGKYGKSKKISLVGQQLQKDFPIGLLVSLKFPPDSTLLAVGSSQNVIYVLYTGTWELLSIIGEPSDGFCSVWGVFAPLHTHECLISCTSFGQVEQWEIQLQERKIESQRSHGVMDLFDESHATVACSPSFAPNGKMLAVGFSNGRVVIIDPNLFCTLWVICPEFLDDDQYTSRFSASSLCFSKSCQYLAIGYYGDIVTVWSLPRSTFTLKHFCRTVIISLCPPSTITKLPIPSSLKQYLLYQPMEVDDTTFL